MCFLKVSFIKKLCDIEISHCKLSDVVIYYELLLIVFFSKSYVHLSKMLKLANVKKCFGTASISLGIV